MREKKPVIANPTSSRKDSRPKLIIVSNRLPVSVSKQGGKLVYTPSTGGLATAMSSLEGEAAERIWIGWPGIAAEELNPRERAAVTRKLRTYGCYPVYLTSNQVKNFYEGYANDTIWPLFHYFQSLAQFNLQYWASYKEVSQVFKAAVLKQVAPNSAIWIHDYHLMLLPGQLREALPDSSIGFFLHIPFPSYEIFRLLPDRREILNGLMGADLIGFHVYDYARHFLSSVLRTLGLESVHGVVTLEGRTVKTDVFPIGIDYQKFTVALGATAVRHGIKDLYNHYEGQTIILSVDRLDYSKGILKRLEAFEQLLRENPHYHKKLVLVVIAVPSRTEVETYKELRDSIEQTIGRINGRYASVDWTPISYQFKNLPFEQLIALYAAADIALVTPLRDGMNLVAKEYVASKQTRPGVLILSEMAGAIDELPEALRVNPNDTASMVRAVKIALKMPKVEQRSRLKSMQRRLSRYTVQRWAADFIEQLGQSKQTQTQQNNKSLSGALAEDMVDHFQAAKRRAIFLDYDGTLRNFLSSHDPSRAAPSKSLLNIVSGLVGRPDTDVCIISGRPREALDKWFGHLPVALAAEHGAWVKDGGEWSQEEFSFTDYKKLLLPVLERFAERTPGARIEEKNFALVWHYRNVPPELAYARNASLKHELNQLLGGGEVAIHSGNKIIEIKPRRIHKGTVISEQLAIKPADFMLCIGDDYTDEAMFEALPEEAYSINVGNGETLARLQIPSIERVLKLLKTLSNS